MKFCTKCGNKLLENDKFCSECGTAVKQKTIIDEINSNSKPKNEEDEKINDVVGTIFASSSMGKEYLNIDEKKRYFKNRHHAFKVTMIMLFVLIFAGIIIDFTVKKACKHSSEAIKERAVFYKYAKEYQFLDRNLGGAEGSNKLFTPERIVSYIRDNEFDKNDIPQIDDYEDNSITTEAATYYFEVVNENKVVIEIDE